MYLIDATPEQRRVLRSVSGAYINGDATDAQVTTFDTKILPAMNRNYPSEAPDPEWVGILENCLINTAKMPTLPACRVIVCGSLP